MRKKMFLSAYSVFSIMLVSLTLSVRELHGAGKKHPALPPKPDVGRKIIALNPIPRIRIEMPDRSEHEFGKDYQIRLTSMLTQTGKYTVVLLPDAVPEEKLSGLTETPPPSYSWPGSVTPSVVLRVQVEALSFTTGSRGERTVYGFDERLLNQFNDGSGKFYNEFPLRFISIEPSWFGDTFQKKGSGLWDSRSGLDLGDGFGINLLFAWMNVKYAKFHSELHLRLEVEKPYLDASSVPVETHWIQVKGDGFFFDVAGAYDKYSLGISIARRDGMLQALLKALDNSMVAIEHALNNVPSLAKVDAVMQDGAVLLGTGFESGIPKGTLFELVPKNEESSKSEESAGQGSDQLILEVQSSGKSGSVARVIQGDLNQGIVGRLARQMMIPPARDEAGKIIPRGGPLLSQSLGSRVSSETVQIPPDVIPGSKLKVPSVSPFEAFLRSLAEGFMLSYRIWRYYHYDLPYKIEPDGGKRRTVLGEVPAYLLQEEWADRIGLTSLAGHKMYVVSAPPVVAILDSGIDYNHPLLHRSLWLNPSPWRDPLGREDRYGWDFFSGDSRPFDDGYHGTQVASLVAGLAPLARIMPLKVFNPWGITSSAAIYSAFIYAVDHGADLILCAWSTPIRSRALELGIQYAREHGVVVIVAAGDEGYDLDESPVYPAAFSAVYDNVLTVTGVDSSDHLFTAAPDSDQKKPGWRNYRSANHGSRVVKIAAPARDISVAEPRSHMGKESSTGLAAAIVAGAFARSLGQGAFSDVSPSTTHSLDLLPSALIQRFLGESDTVPDLTPSVEKGRRVRVNF